MLAEEIIKAKPEAEVEVKGILEGNEAEDIPQSNGAATGEATGHETRSRQVGVEKGYAPGDRLAVF